MTKAKTAAARALEIDESLPEAHTAQARVLLFYDWDWLGGESELNRALLAESKLHGSSSHVLALSHSYGQERTIAWPRAKEPWTLIRYDILLNLHLGWNHIYATPVRPEQSNNWRRTTEMDPSFFFEPMST